MSNHAHLPSEATCSLQELLLSYLRANSVEPSHETNCTKYHRAKQQLNFPRGVRCDWWEQWEEMTFQVERRSKGYTDWGLVDTGRHDPGEHDRVSVVRIWALLKT